MFIRLGDSFVIEKIKESKSFQEASFGHCPSTRTNSSKENVTSNKRIVSIWEPDKYLYLRCRAITADKPNQNGDYFPLEEIEKSYHTFIGKGFYKDHQTESVDLIKGKILSARIVKYGDNYVETLVAVDRKKDPEFVRQLDNNIINSVSMGCMVENGTCSVCGNTAYHPKELCSHMNPDLKSYCKGSRNEKGIIYEINRGIVFAELSGVSIPADPQANIFEEISMPNKVVETALDAAIFAVTASLKKK